jgi:hypothetical protein
MRYELRRYRDETKSSYVVRQTSDDRDAIISQYNRALSASTAPHLIHIVDTESEKKD